jgi:hypothetical protein
MVSEARRRITKLVLPTSRVMAFIRVTDTSRVVDADDLTALRVVSDGGARPILADSLS